MESLTLVILILLREVKVDFIKFNNFDDLILN